MRILVYMPLSEVEAAASARLMAKMINIPGLQIFSMPAFFDFVLEVGKAKTLTQAYMYSLIAMAAFLEDAGNKNTILIGTSAKEYEFDVIIGYNTGLQEITSEDLVRASAREEVMASTDEQYKKIRDSMIEALDSLYGPEDCESHLTNEAGIIKFLEELIQDDGQSAAKA